MEPEGGIRGRSSHCQKPAPGYDHLRPRRWLSVPVWNVPTYFRYAPRRVMCREPGVVVEHIPWSEGKRPVTCNQLTNSAEAASSVSNSRLSPVDMPPLLTARLTVPVQWAGFRTRPPGATEYDGSGWIVPGAYIGQRFAMQSIYARRPVRALPELRGVPAGVWMEAPGD